MNTSRHYQPQDPTAAALQAHILQATEAARTSIAGTAELHTIEAGARAFFQAVDQLPEHLKRIQEDPDLNDAARDRKRAEAIAGMNTLREVTEQDINEAAAAYERRHAATLEPVPPVADPLLLEAKLQTARMDARMLLDNAGQESLPLAMYQAATGTDPMLSYLLLATPWGEKYLTGRGLPADVMLGWNDLKARAYPAVLSEQQAAAQAAIRGLSKTAGTITAAHDLLVTAASRH